MKEVWRIQFNRGFSIKEVQEHCKLTGCKLNSWAYDDVGTHFDVKDIHSMGSLIACYREEFVSVERIG